MARAKYVAGAAAGAECVAIAVEAAKTAAGSEGVARTDAGTECVARDVAGPEYVAGAGANCIAEAGSELGVGAGDECLTKEEADIVTGARAECVARAGDDCAWEARATIPLTSGKAIMTGEGMAWARAWEAVRRVVVESAWSRAAAGWACGMTGGKGGRTASALAVEEGAGKAVWMLTGAAWGGAGDE